MPLPGGTAELGQQREEQQHHRDPPEQGDGHEQGHEAASTACSGRTMATRDGSASTTEFAERIADRVAAKMA